MTAMTFRRGLHVAALSISAALFASCSSSNAKPRGEVMLAIATDMSITKDMDQVQVEVFGDDGQSIAPYDLKPLAGGFPMPGTVSLVPPGSGGQHIRVRVTAKHHSGGLETARVVREATVKVPEDRVALLRMPLRWLCDGMVKAGDDLQTYSSDCPVAGDTCIAGTCGSPDIDTNALPDYSPALVFGGGDEHGKGSTCLDMQECFGSETTIPLDDATTCSVPLPDGADPAHLNVAMVLKPGSDGHCLADTETEKGKCYLPLDSDENEGFFIDGDRIRLPPAVCRRQKVEQAVQGIAISRSCKTKDLSIPVCGPWTGWPQAAPPDNGASSGGGGSIVGPDGGFGGTGAGGAGNSTSSPPDGGNLCAPVATGAVLATPYYFVLVDASASMQQALPTVRQALSQFVAEPANAGTRFGLQLSKPACSPDYSTPVVPFTALPAVTLPQFTAATDSGLLLDSAMGQSLVVVDAPPGPASRTFVIITAAHDDQQVGCGAGTDLMQQTVRDALTAGVSLRPIVIPNSTNSPNLMQGFSVTGSPAPVQLNAPTPQQIAAELDKYRDQIAKCTYVAPATPYSVQMAAGRPVLLTQVDSAAACTSATQYYKPTTTTFTLCPATCTASGTASIETLGGCGNGTAGFGGAPNIGGGSNGGRAGGGGANGSSGGAFTCPVSCNGSCTQYGCAVTLANAANGTGPTSLAVDAQHLYYPTSGGLLRSLAKTGGPAQTLVNGEQGPHAIAVDSQSIYWLTQTAVRKAAITGGAAVPVASGGKSLLALTIDSTNVYYSDAAGAIFSEPLAGGPVPTQIAAAAATSIAVDATSAYWSINTGLFKGPIGGGTATPLSQTSRGYGAIAVTPSNLYWTVTTGVFGAGLDGTNPVSLSNTATPANSVLRVDATYAYWTAGTAVLRAPLTGAGPTVQLATQAANGVLAIDSTSVYYSTAQGDIVRFTPFQN